MTSPDLDAFHMREIAKAWLETLQSDAHPLSDYVIGLRWEPSQPGVQRLAVLLGSHAGHLRPSIPLYGDDAAHYHLIVMLSPLKSDTFVCLAGTSVGTGRTALGERHVDADPLATAADMLQRFAAWIEGEKVCQRAKIALEWQVAASARAA